jgi:hypothetical protein
MAYIALPDPLLGKRRAKITSERLRLRPVEVPRPCRVVAEAMRCNAVNHTLDGLRWAW